MGGGLADEVTLTVMVLMTLVDGQVDEPEMIRMRFIHGKIVGRPVSEAEVRAIIAKVADDPPDVVSYLERMRDLVDPDERRRLLRAAYAIATADGRVLDEEDALMLGLAKALAIPPQEYRATLTQLSVARDLDG